MLKKQKVRLDRKELKLKKFIMFFLILKFIAPSTLRASVTIHHETNFLLRKLKANWSDNKSWTTSSTCLSETPESRLSSSRFGPKKVQKRNSSSFAKLHFLLKETLIYLPRFPPKKSWKIERTEIGGHCFSWDADCLRPFDVHRAMMVVHPICSITLQSLTKLHLGQKAEKLQNAFVLDTSN